ncbi:MAG: hypothetical protein Q7J34_02655 [Bacteroidales bacterium]|nr:hypothetical protein [Bacteroidales bacterium]
MRTTDTIKALLCFLIAFSGIFPVSAENQNNHLLGKYSFDGNTKDLSKNAFHARLISGYYIADRNNKNNMALVTPAKDATSLKETLTFPFEIDPSINPIISVSCWLMPLTTIKSDIIMLGEGKYSRGLVIAKDDETYCWALKCGKDDLLFGPPAIANQWTFITFLYDLDNQQARLIVDDKIYARRAECPKSKHKMKIGWANSAFDELYILDTIPELAWLQSLYGQEITGNVDKYSIKERFSYKKRNKAKEDSLTQIGKVFIVFTKEVQIRDSSKLRSVIAMLGKNDSLLIIAKNQDGMLKVKYNNNKNGFISTSTLLSNAYPSGSSVLLYKAKRWMSDLFNFSYLNNWIMALILAVAVFFIRRYFTRIDDAIIKLSGYDEVAGGGSKSGTSIHKEPGFLRRFFPIERMRWYPMLPGFIIAFTFLLGAVWDGKEMEWFYNEGFNILPIGYDRAIHYVLYLLSLTTILITLLWILESFVVAGPIVGLLRILTLIIINIIVLIASFYIMALIVLIIAGIFVLRVLGSTFGSQNYRCPSCGTGFSATPGMGGRCPGCGTSLST